MCGMKEGEKILETIYYIYLNKERNVHWLVELCNNNQGFISAILTIGSLLLSVIAIIISLSISKGQVQAQLLERRINVYSNVKEVYTIAKELLEKTKGNYSYYRKMGLITAILFLYNSNEYNTAVKLMDLYQEIKKREAEGNDKNDEYLNLLEECVDTNIEMLNYESSINKELENLKTYLHLLYSKDVNESLVRLIENYQEFRKDLWDLDEKKLEERFNNLEAVFNKVNTENVFLKMDKETTSKLHKKVL